MTRLEKSTVHYHNLETIVRLEPNLYNHTFKALKDLKHQQAVAAYLSEIGFRQFAYFDSGEHAIVLDTVEDQLVRIVLSIERKRDFVPHVLQPIYATSELAEHALGFRIDVLPKLFNKGTEVHEHALEVALAKVHYHFRSLYSRNVMLLPDGTPIIVDGDAVLTEAEFREKVKQRFVNIYRDVKTFDEFKSEPDPPYYWGEMNDQTSWKQKKLLPQIGTGELTGVIPGQRLRALEVKFGTQDHLVVAIRDEGLYPVQLSETLNYRLAVAESRVLVP